MLSVRLDAETEKFLNTLASETHHSKSFFVKEALKNYMQDMQDFRDAQQRSQAEDRNLISLDQLEKALEL